MTDIDHSQDDSFSHAPSARTSSHSSASVPVITSARPSGTAPAPYDGETMSLALVEEIVRLRATGYTWSQISVDTSVPPAQCAYIVSNYLQGQYGNIDETEARQLQIRRLEMIMTTLWKQVEQGDVLSEGRQTTNLINTINQVTDLLDLKRSKINDAKIELTQAQTSMISQTIRSVQAATLTQVLDIMTEMSQYDADTGRRSISDATAVRTAIEEQWAGWFSTAVHKALTESGEVT